MKLNLKVLVRHVINRVNKICELLVKRIRMKMGLNEGNKVNKSYRVKMHILKITRRNLKSKIFSIYYQWSEN